MKQVNTCIRVLAFTTLILLLLGQNTTYPQQWIPVVDKIPTGSITIEVMMTKDMFNKGYYYRVYYVTNGDFPIWTVFYKTGIQRHKIAYSSKEARQPAFNKFFVIGSWNELGEPGVYKIAIMSPKEPDFLQEMIQTVRFSSNTKQALEDDKTLIVNESTGVAPRKGTEKFNIRYQLNEASDMIHKIIQKKDNEEIWNEELPKVQEGTRGFDWNRQNAQKDRWYRAEIEARLVSDKSKWDRDLSDKFQNLK